MASVAQITANRANAQLSAGPCTPEGKLAASRNARRHGFTSMKLEIPAADRQEFDKFRQDLHKDVRPEGAIEESLFERLLLASWNLRRITRYETELLDETNPFAPGASIEAAAFDRLARYRRDLERSSQRTLADLRKLQTQRAVLLQQTDQVVQAIYGATPLAELTQLTCETDPIIERNSPYRKVFFYKTREAAAQAASAPQEPAKRQQARQAASVTCLDPTDHLPKPPISF